MMIKSPYASITLLAVLALSINVYLAKGTIELILGTAHTTLNTINVNAFRNNILLLFDGLFKVDVEFSWIDYCTLKAKVYDNNYNS